MKDGAEKLMAGKPTATQLQWVAFRVSCFYFLFLIELYIVFYVDN